jgi:hypothetical protein
MTDHRNPAMDALLAAVNGSPGLNLQNILDSLRRVMPAQVAAEIASVQPMDEAGKAIAEPDAILAANPGSHLVITSGKTPKQP